MEDGEKIFRTVLLVRHGQFTNSPQKLTAVGRRQAELTGKALRPVRPTFLYSSTMPRARETAKIIAKQIGTGFSSKSCFNEGFLPGTIEFESAAQREGNGSQRFSARANAARVRADQAFDFLFQRPTQTHETLVIVTHGNFIRRTVCKALKISESKWKSLAVMHTSFTAIRICEKGKFMMLRFSDVGHLAVKMRTF